MDYLIAPEKFESDRLVLRSWMPGDGPRLSEAVNRSYEHLKPWMAWAKPEQSESERRVRQNRGHWLLADDFVVAILDPKQERVLGGCGFHLRHGSLSLGIAEIGMWIRGDVAGQGFGSEALLAMLHWGFTAWPWQRLVWKCDIDNGASRRVAEKAGMAFEGITRGDDLKVDGVRRRDTAWYAALRANFRPSPWV